MRGFVWTSVHDFCNSATNAVVDFCSRLPLATTDSTTNDADAADVFAINQLHTLPVTSDTIERDTQCDTILSRVYQLTASGWGNTTNTAELAPYYSRRHKLAVHQGCLLWGGWVVIPTKLRQRILDQLHEAHSGVVKMKCMARSYVWWPNIDSEIEGITKKCPGCIATQNEPAQRHYIHGNGQANHGNAFILTTAGHT